MNEVPDEAAYSCTLGNLDWQREYTVTVTAISAGGESTAVAAAAARPLQVIPVPTLGDLGVGQPDVADAGHGAADAASTRSDLNFLSAPIGSV